MDASFNHYRKMITVEGMRVDRPACSGGQRGGSNCKIDVTPSTLRVQEGRGTCIE